MRPDAAGAAKPPGLARVWAWRAVAVVPAWAIATFLADDRVPPPLRAEAAIVLLATLVRPVAGLLLVAAVAPLGDVVTPLVGGTPLHHAEGLVVAFLAAWLSSHAGTADDSRPVPLGVTNAMIVFGSVVVASCAATALQLHGESWFALYQTRVALAHDYLWTNDFIGVHAAGALLEGLGLMAAASALARHDAGDRMRVALALAAAGVVASAASWLLSIGVAPAATLARTLAVGLPRYSAISTDVNATASLYLLLAGVCAGVAASMRRGWIVWVPAVFLLARALLLTDSVAAIMALALVACVAIVRWIAIGRSRPLKIAACLIVAVIVAGLVTFGRTPRSESSLEVRGGFTRASLRMIEARPIAGIGVGRYYPLSRLTLPPSLAWSYGFENAHDYYLQIAAELGLAGAAAFGWLLAAALLPAIKWTWRGRADGLTVGLLSGTLMYLVTAVAGHPFLVPEAAMPFWIVVGLIVSQAPARTRMRSVWPARVAFAAAAALLLTLPLRNEEPALRLSSGEDGLGPAQIDDTGESFRRADVFASLFVAPAITGVDVPVRLARDVASAEALVDVKVPGWQTNEVRVGHRWTMLHVALPGPEPLMPRQRINLALVPLPESRPEPLRLDVGAMRLAQAR